MRPHERGNVSRRRHSTRLRALPKNQPITVPNADADACSCSCLTAVPVTKSLVRRSDDWVDGEACLRVLAMLRSAASTTPAVAK